MGRNKAPSENTIRILCGRAAGMCEFEGCNKRLFYDGVTHGEFNNAYVAHIVASSASGPRGDKTLSPELSDKLENLMLMCADHHKLIDVPSTGPINYPVERLQEMKRKHEEKIDRFCSLFYVPKSEVVILTSPIKGNINVNIDYNQATRAILPNKQPASNYGTRIRIQSEFDYNSSDYWNDCSRQLVNSFNKYINNAFIQSAQAGLSIFAIAPIPLISKFGELIGDKIPCDVFQKTREPDTWQWISNEATNDFVIEETELELTNNKVAIILSLTNDIDNSRVLSAGSYKKTYKIKATRLGVDSIKSRVDLSLFWHKYQNVCDNILNKYGKDIVVDLFPAIPNSAAFEIGRRYMPNAYPRITIFDENRGFIKTITLGGE